MNKKIIFLVTEDWYFCSHRLSLACAARDEGYDVVVVTKVSKHKENIERHGIKVIDLSFKRKDKSIVKSIKIIKNICDIYNMEKPDIVHHISLQTVVLGSIAAIITKAPVVINSLTGLGFLFTSNKLVVRLIKVLVVEPTLKLLFSRKNTWAILQNIDDKRLLMSFDILKDESSVLIRGSGVDLSLFSGRPESDETPKIVFASRMLKDKGVMEFIEAVKELKERKVKAVFVLVGDVDEGNPSSIDKHDLENLQNNGVLEWWGHQDNMNKVFEQSHIVCLPSHREGLPKVLLEAAAASRPIVASDVPGCREIVHDGTNGLLVRVKDSSALANAIEQLLDNKALRIEMGINGRDLVEREFTSEIINRQTLVLYGHITQRMSD